MLWRWVDRGEVNGCSVCEADKFFWASDVFLEGVECFVGS